MNKHDKIAGLAQQIIELSGGRPAGVSPSIKYWIALGMVVDLDNVTPEMIIEALKPLGGIDRTTLFYSRKWKKVRDLLNIRADSKDKFPPKYDEFDEADE